MDYKLLGLNATRKKRPSRATSGLRTRQPAAAEPADALIQNKASMWRAGVFRTSTVVACLTGACGIAHADQTGSINWRNGATDPLRVTLQSSNSCVTDAGPSSFAVNKDDEVVNQLKVKSGCDVSVAWNFEQARKGGGGQLAGRIYYVQLSDGRARIKITYTQFPNNRTPGAHYFRAACGSQVLTCLENTVLRSRQPRAWIYSMALPAEMVGPLRFG